MTTDTGSVHIGSLGTKRPQGIRMHFDYFGATVRVAPYATDLAFHDFLDKAAAIEVVDVDALSEEMDPAELARIQKEAAAQFALVLNFVKEFIHPEDWPTFLSTAKANGQSTMDVMEVGKALVEAISAFPTGRPSDSSSGRPTTGQRSTPDSSPGATTPAQPHATRRDQAVRRALSIMDGRPDIQVAILNAQEHTRPLAA